MLAKQKMVENKFKILKKYEKFGIIIKLINIIN